MRSSSPSLDRPLSGGTANVTVNLVEPGTMYGERMNQLDLRFAKILRFSMRRASLNVDLYNALNGNAVIQQSNTFGNWQQPQGVLVGRSMKFSVAVPTFRGFTDLRTCELQLSMVQECNAQIRQLRKLSE